MRVVSVMSMASTEHGQHEYIDNEEDYTYDENEVPPQSMFKVSHQFLRSGIKFTYNSSISKNHQQITSNIGLFFFHRIVSSNVCNT